MGVTRVSMALGDRTDFIVFHLWARPILPLALVSCPINPTGPRGDGGPQRSLHKGCCFLEAGWTRKPGRLGHHDL